MDPNKTLRRIRELASGLESPDELAWLIDALDRWICNDGAFPDAWNQQNSA